MVDNFEDGKPLEEMFDAKKALDELDSLPIDVENEIEDTQPLEVVAEAPVRNQKEKKKELPKETPEPKAEVATPKPTPVVEEPQIPIQEESPPEVIEQPAPQPVIYTGIDDYLQKRKEQIRLEYLRAGEAVSEQFVQNSIQNLIAVVNGQVRLVPVQQEQPAPQPAPEVKVPVESEVDKQLRRIDEALRDPAMVDAKPALLKKKYELLGVPIQEVTVDAPVVRRNKDVPKTKPPWGVRRVIAVLGAAIAFCALVAAVIVLTLG